MRDKRVKTRRRHSEMVKVHREEWKDDKRGENEDPRSACLT